MVTLASKTGNGCFWLGRDNGKYLVKVDDGITLDETCHPMSYDTARQAFDNCYDQYEQADFMERHAYWNVCEALQEYIAEEENVSA